MADKLDLVFKKAVNRQYTSNSKAWYEELGTVPYKLKGSDIWIEPIPSTPQAISGRITLYTLQTLTQDTSVANARAWLFCTTPGDTNTRAGSFIPPRYGQSYGVRLYNQSNTEIPTTHAIGWFFDYESGIVTFDNNPSTYSFTSFKVTVYQYIGKTSDDLVKYDGTLGNLIVNPGDGNII